MSESQEKAVPTEPNINGDGDSHDVVDEAEFFLVPLLATDPLPYLFDGDGNPVNADGIPLADGNGVPEALRKVQEEARPRRSSSS